MFGEQGQVCLELVILILTGAEHPWVPIVWIQ